MTQTGGRKGEETNALAKQYFEDPLVRNERHCVVYIQAPKLPTAPYQAFA